jgi:ubiquinone/menaquinone biosynthesis methyltransferase
LFATIADRYDLITILLSYGRDRRWKSRLADLARVRPGETALDLACGTGDISFSIASRGARVVGLDITPRMIELAQKKRGGGPLPPSFLVGDIVRLPFPDQSFDLVTLGYGLRNVPVLGDAIAEIRRVLRPGGRIWSLDFNRPASAPVRIVYLTYLTLVGSLLGFVLHGDPDTYRYIPESIRRYPGADGVAAMMRTAGFADAGYVPVLGGLMAINYARR